MQTTVNGLLSQKPNSAAPKPDDERWFSWQEKKSQKGKSYFKIKNETQEHGGRLCRVISAEKTDYVDPHGNISFSVEFEPIKDTNGARPAQEAVVRPAQETRVEPDADETDPVLLARQALMRAANAQYLIKKAVTAECEQSKIDGMETTPENFGGQCGSLFRYLDQLGLVRKMPLKPLWSPIPSAKKDVDRGANVEQDW